MATFGWTPTEQTPAVRISGIDDFAALQGQMMDLLDRFSNLTNLFDPNQIGVAPPLNMSEDEENIYVTVELPGLQASEIDLSLANGQLIIQGERKLPDIDQHANLHRRERNAGAFRRSIALPNKINPDGVAAVSRNGVLEITLPKTENAKPRQIDIMTV